MKTSGSFDDFPSTHDVRSRESRMIQGLPVQADTDYQVSTESRNGTAAVRIQGRVTVGNAQRLLNEITAQLPHEPQTVELDLSGVEYFDSGGGALLIRLRRSLAAGGGSLRVTQSTPDIDGFLSLLNQDALQEELKPPPRPPALTVRVGEAALQSIQGMREFAAFTGEVVLGLRDAILHPRRIRWRDTWLYMERAGRDGLPIVLLISFLMGLITAFQAAVQLKEFGAEIYVANLVGLSITRELGPLMTAIIAAGRSGAAFAAEIGTMKVSEEVDALAAMGFDRTRFLVTPKVIALLLMLPCLTLFADLIGIIGGLFVAVFNLGLPAVVYMRQMALYMTFNDIGTGLIKSVVFALLIATIGCLRGFQARSGAESVGRITTSAIVSGIFSIIVADAIFTLLFHDW
jgi:phospholipid/cholesterol/gamma-HCH transport system permease protein